MAHSPALTVRNDCAVPNLGDRSNSPWLNEENDLPACGDLLTRIEDQSKVSHFGVQNQG
jgi:hypothetical protein